jgi:hypothetical protein
MNLVDPLDYPSFHTIFDNIDRSEPVSFVFVVKFQSAPI